MSQKALLQTSPKRPLILDSRPIPQPGPGELLVKVTSAGLNPHDAKSRFEGLFVFTHPFIPGNDIAGEVIALGAGDAAAKFAVGEHVFAQSKLPMDRVWNDFNALQQFALVDIRYTAKVPGNITDDDAATLPINAITAFVTLFHESGHHLSVPGTSSRDLSGESLLVVGGSTNCGRFVIQLAHLAGFGKVVAVAGSASAQELRDMGATHVVDRQADDALGQIRGIVGDDLVYAVDTFNSGPDQELGVAALSGSKRGLLITILPTDGEFDAGRIGEKTAGYDRRFVSGSIAVHSDAFAESFTTHISDWIADGKIRPSKYRVIEGLDADAVNEALGLFWEGRGMKVQVHPN